MAKPPFIAMVRLTSASKGMPVKETETVILDHESVECRGALFVPEGPGPHPAVLVMPSAMGLGPAYRAIAAKLAGEGYVALAADVYGGAAHFTDPPDAAEPFDRLTQDPMRIRARTVAWFDLLRARSEVDPDHVAAIGYCLGGKCVLELARSGAAARAAICFHGILGTARPAEPGTIVPLVAVYAGAKDPYAPPADVEAFQAEMRTAGARWHLTIFGDACHAFTTREDGGLPIDGVAYDPLADAISWAGMLALLDGTLRHGA